MNDQAAHVTHIGEVGEKLERRDEAFAVLAHRRALAFQPEGEDRPRTLRQIFLRQRVVLVARQPGVGHPRHPLVALKKTGDLLRVADVPVHPQRKRLEPLDKQERIHWRDTRSHVAHRFRARLHQKSVVAEGVDEPEIVVRRRGRGDAGEAAEIEPARVEDRARDGIAVAADELRRRIINQRRAPFHRPAEIRRGEGVVDDEGNAVRIRKIREFFQIENGAARIADRLAVKRARLRRDRRLPRREVARIAQGHFQRQFQQRLLELRDGASIEMRRRHNLVAGRKQRHQRDELRRHAAGHHQRARRALQRREPFLQHRRGRVADARVDVAVLLELEKLRRLVGAVEDVGGRLVNRHGARAGRGIGNVARMHHARVEAKGARRGGAHEPPTLPANPRGGQTAKPAAVKPRPWHSGQNLQFQVAEGDREMLAFQRDVAFRHAASRELAGGKSVHQQRERAAPRRELERIPFADPLHMADRRHLESLRRAGNFPASRRTSSPR